MAAELGREIHTSSNGDRWDLLVDPGTGHSFVRHSANPASGGYVSDIGLSAFLADGRGGPEHQALWRMIASLVGDGAAPTITAT
jgi:hypothetical protein